LRPYTTTQITAAIPIVMPRTVRELRSLFLSSDLTDAPKRAVESTWVMLPGKPCAEVGWQFQGGSAHRGATCL